MNGKNRLASLFLATSLLACGEETKPVKRASAPVVAVKADAGVISPGAPEKLTASPEKVTASPEKLAELSAKDVVTETPEFLSQNFDDVMKEGKDLVEKKDFVRALTRFERAVVLKPQDAMAKIRLGQTLLGLGRKVEARKYVEEGLDVDDTVSFGWNQMGRLELAEKNLEGAKLAFERATQEDADNIFAWNNLGYVYLQTESYEDAVTCLETATAGKGVTPYMWNNLGMAYEKLDRLREARAAYSMAKDNGSEKGDTNKARLDELKELNVEVATLQH